MPSRRPPSPPPGRANAIGRRELGRRLGAALLAAPFFDLLARPRQARAATTAPAAKRLVVFFSPNGTVPSHWRPSGSGTSWTIPAGSILEPVAAHKDRLIAISGLEFKNASNHAGGMAAMLTAQGSATDESGGMSVDQYVAKAIGGSTRLRSLDLGVQTSAWGAGEQTRMSYSAPGTYVPPDDDPVSAFRRVFGTTTGGVDPLLARRQSVLDAVKGDLGDLRKQIGREEQAKLDQHLTSIRELERSLSVNACSGGAAPTGIAKDANDAFPDVGKAQMDLLVAALACGATRVASLQWSFTVSPTVFSWGGLADGHHSLSHIGDGDAAGVANFVKAERWYAAQFAYLLGKLVATPDPAGGTLLDSTLVLWCKEMGDSRLHVCTDVPMVLAGGGVFQPGRYLDAGGASHARLLVSICHAMGLSNTTFGDARNGAGTLAGL